MKNSTKDEMQGKFHEVKGNVKKKAGKLVDSRRLEAEGRTETFAGKVQQWADSRKYWRSRVAFQKEDINL